MATGVTKNAAVAEILGEDGLEDAGPVTMTKENLLMAEPPPEDGPAPASALFERLNHPPAPAPRVSKAEIQEERQSAKDARPAPPGLRSLGWIAKKFPGSEKIKIHLRSVNGQRGLVGTYSVNDLAKTQDMETFLSMYIMPSYGPGEYEITAIDSRGNAFEGGSILLLGPTTDMLPQPGNKNAAMDVIEKLLDKSQQRPIVQSAPADPIRDMERVADLQEKLTGGAKNEQQSALAAIIQSSADQNRAMMQMIMETNARGREPDPMMLMLMKMLLERDSAPAAPLPPMPPPVNTAKEMMEMMTVLLTALRPPQDDSKELFKALLLQRDADRMGPREIMEIVKTMTPSAPAAPSGSDFKETIENLMALQNLATNLKPQEGGGGPTSFWDALGALFSNKGLASSVAEVIRTRSGGGAPAVQVLPVAQQPRALPAAVIDAAAQELEQRAELVRRQRLELAKTRLAAEQKALAEETAAAAASPGAQPIAAAAPPAATAEQEAAVARVQEKRGSIPQLPPNIAEHVNAMVMATDDAALVESVINFVFYLNELPDWQQFAQTILHFVMNGDQKSTIEYLSKLFEGLVSLQLMDAEMKNRIAKVLAENFDAISTMAKNAGSDGDDEEESDDDEEDEDESDDDDEDENEDDA